MKHLDLENNNKDEYLKWRDRKLMSYPTCAADITVNINNPNTLSKDERKLVAGHIKTYNIAFYKSNDINNKNIVKTLEREFNLYSVDYKVRNTNGFSYIKDNDKTRPKKKDTRYIPYTNQALNWHTDGYYNEDIIRSVIIHCERQARAGGENKFLDNDIAYIALRDKDIDYIKILMEKDVMTIPANIQNNVLIRKEISSPVIIANKSKIDIRYTERKINIKWKESKLLTEALSYLKEVLKSSPYIIKHRLEKGEGLICNNILHKRTAFIDNKENLKRLIHRIRYLTRVNII